MNKIDVITTLWVKCKIYPSPLGKIICTLLLLCKNTQNVNLEEECPAFNKAYIIYPGKILKSLISSVPWGSEQGV